VDIEYLENVNKSEEYIKVLINDIADNQMRVTQCIPVTLELQGDPCEGQKFEDSKGHIYEVKKVSDNPYVVKILENDFLKKLGKEHVSFPDYYLIVDDQDIVKGVDTFVFYAFGENTSGNNYKLVEYYQIWDAPDFDENVDIYLMGEYGNSQYPEDENQIYIDFNLVGKGELKRPYMANIDNVKKELDKGKVLICTISGMVKMRSTGETVSAGHAINIYRYEDYIDESGKNCVKLFVYDSNFPGNDQLFIDIKPSEVKEDCFDYCYSGASFPWSSDNLAYQFTIFDDDCYYVTSPYIDMKKTEKYDPETDSIYYLSSLQDGIDTEITNTELQKAREKGKFTILSSD